MEEPKRRGLGRGLSALLQEGGQSLPPAEPRRGSREVPIERLRANPAQPRRQFGEAELEELAASIREKGVLQPLLVRRVAGGGDYEIVAGERRWRAAQRAGLHEVPVLVRELSDAEALELALIENLQRQDLSALEEAEAYRQLVDERGRGQEEVARAVGKSRSHVANMLRLLGLPAAVQELLRQGRLSAGHARALVGREDAAALAERILARGLNVRQAERLVQDNRAAPAGRRPADPNIRDFERRLGEALGVRAEVRDRDGRGELRLHYRSLEQLDELARRLGLAETAA